ncbi:MAG: aminopeptidase P family protein [Gemmatimonadetes bacterium]|nr:aminopeptidase P family protein [Gemmatimonadota bacterium]
MMRWLVMLLAVGSSAAAQQSALDPVPELPGQGRPVDIAATRARRDRLATRAGQGIVVVRAALSRDLEAEVLQDSDFRQDDDFFYLTGLETPDAWLVLAATPAGLETHLFLPPRQPEQERWTGLKLGPGPDAVRLSGIPFVHDVARLDSVTQVLAERVAGPVHGLTRYSDGAPLLPAPLAGRPLRDIEPLLDSLRVVKDAAEVTALRRAVSITAEAHKAAMRAARPGMMEYQLEAVVEYTFRDLGADRVGFPSIVGSGSNATTLHYDVNRRRAQEGDLVVIDVGAEYAQYTADVTRTIPMSGRFTPRQRAVYDLVLASQQAALDAVRPGVTVRQLTQVARAYMQTHSGDLCAPKNCVEYFVHGLSHWLGMRVHDVGDYRMPLEPGMVLTVEPGIYIPHEQLGVRIEDDILVTADGYELLSAAAPRRAADVEALMSEGTRNAPVPGGTR